MNIQQLAQFCECSPEQALVAHKVAEFRLNRSLPLPLTQADATICCLTLCVLKSAVEQYAIADVIQTAGLSESDSAILETLKPAEVVGEVVRVAPAEIAIAA